MKFACCGELTDGASGGAPTLICIKCKCPYHVQCLGFTAQNKKDLNYEFKKKWMCPNCAPKVQNKDSTPIRSTGTVRQPTGSENITVQRGGSRTKDVLSPPLTDCGLDAPLTLRAVKELLASELEKMRSEFESTMNKIISKELKTLREEVADFKQSLSFLNSQQEDLTKRIIEVENTVKPLICRSAELGEMKATINTFEVDKNKQEQWARRSNVEIFGIPEKKGENLLKIVEAIGRAASFPVNIDTDLDFVTRVAPKGNNSKKPKPIVVRFLARYKKDNFLASARRIKPKLKDIGFTGDSLAYVNDHLTSANKALLQSTKKLCKEKDYNYVWVKNCSILARRSDTSPIIPITSLADLSKIK